MTGHMVLPMLLAVAVHGAVCMDDDQYGPLSSLIGTWHGVVGVVRSTRSGFHAPLCYRETVSFVPTVPVAAYGAEDDHVHTLKYTIESWRFDGRPLHHEVGLWSWSQQKKQVIRSAIIPQGQVLQAGGSGTTSSAGVTQLFVTARQGDTVWGLLNTPLAKHNGEVVQGFTSTYNIGSGVLWYNDTFDVLSTEGEAFSYSTANCFARSTSIGGAAQASCPDITMFCHSAKEGDSIPELKPVQHPEERKVTAALFRVAFIQDSLQHAPVFSVVILLVALVAVCLGRALGGKKEETIIFMPQLRTHSQQHLQYSY